MALRGMQSRRAGSAFAGRGALPRPLIGSAARHVLSTKLYAQQQVAVVAPPRAVERETEERYAPSSGVEPAPATATAKAPASGGKRQLAEGDRPTTLRNIVFVSSEVAGRGARRSCMRQRAPPPAAAWPTARASGTRTRVRRPTDSA